MRTGSELHLNLDVLWICSGSDLDLICIRSGLISGSELYLISFWYGSDLDLMKLNCISSGSDLDLSGSNMDLIWILSGRGLHQIQIKSGSDVNLMAIWCGSEIGSAQHLNCFIWVRVASDTDRLGANVHFICIWFESDLYLFWVWSVSDLDMTWTSFESELF